MLEVWAVGAAGVLWCQGDGGNGLVERGRVVFVQDAVVRLSRLGGQAVFVQDVVRLSHHHQMWYCLGKV